MKTRRRIPKVSTVPRRAANPLTKGFPQYATVVDGVDVGWGSRDVCDRLTAELKEKPEAARELRDYFKGWKGCLKLNEPAHS